MTSQYFSEIEARDKWCGDQCLLWVPHWDSTAYDKEEWLKLVKNKWTKRDTDKTVIKYMKIREDKIKKAMDKEKEGENKKSNGDSSSKKKCGNPNKHRGPNISLQQIIQSIKNDNAYGLDVLA